VRARAIAAVILRSEAGLTAMGAGRSLLRSRQAVHNLIAKAAPGGDPAAAELVTQVREALYPALLSVQSSLDGLGAPCLPGAGDDALPQPPNAAEPKTSKPSPHKQRASSLPGLFACRLAAGLTKQTWQSEQASRVKRFFVLSTAAQPLRNLLPGWQVR